MTELTVSVQNAAGTVLASAAGEGECWLVYEPEYAPGDWLSVSCGRADQFLVVCLDDAPEGPYPYASANVETRGEMVFAAKNAIDGLKANTFHGEWPYTSWGINRDPRAAWTLEFGRIVELDEAVFYLRADFPHDAWWKKATLNFSDGSRLTVPLEKTAAGQRFPFSPRKAEWVRLDGLEKAGDPSPFPALTQLELWGHELC